MNLKSLTQRRSPVPGLIILAIAGVLGWAAFHSGPEAAPVPVAQPVAAKIAPAAPAKPAVKADLATIYAAYVNNRVAADARYLDAPITTFGIVRKIEGAPEDALVYISDPRDDGALAGAWIRDQSKDVLAMKRGDILPVKCLGGVPVDNKLVLRHCRIIKG